MQDIDKIYEEIIEMYSDNDIFSVEMEEYHLSIQTIEGWDYSIEVFENSNDEFRVEVYNCTDEVDIACSIVSKDFIKTSIIQALNMLKAIYRFEYSL